MNTGKYVQVPVCQFVQDFAPCGDLPDDVLASFASTKFATKLKADKETDMYVPFVGTLAHTSHVLMNLCVCAV